MTLSPVVVFVYNRPEHTQKTFEALARNLLAEDTVLYVFSDGPKSTLDEEKVESVRAYIKKVAGFKRVHLRLEKDNLGLATSIINGVTQVIGEHGRVIVLEDDLVTSHSFLSYMNRALEHYEAVDRVMHVGGYMYPINSRGLPSVFFNRHVSSWGWGTWSRAWQMFEPSVEHLASCFDDERRLYLNLDGAYDFWSHLEKNLKGELNTWAIRWYASVLLNKGLGLYPSTSLVENIGIDGSGVHCGSTSKYDVELRQQQWTVEFPPDVEESPLALARIQHFLRRSEPLGVRLRKLFGDFANASLH